MYTEYGYMPLVLLLLLGRCSFSVLSPDPFISYSLWTVSCLCSVCYWHYLIVLVRNQTKAAWFFCFSIPTIVTRTRLIFTVTSALPLFSSNMLTHQLTHDLNIPHTHQQRAAVKYCICWIAWLLVKLLCCRYYSSTVLRMLDSVAVRKVTVLSVLQQYSTAYAG